MTLLQAAVLGIVSGLSEFLPVSATAHLRLVPVLFGWTFSYDHAHPHDPGAPFTAGLQLGTTLALVVYFWRELLHVSVAWLRGLYDRSVRSSLEYRMGWYLIAVTVPVAAIGLLLDHRIEVASRNLWLLASTLIAVAVALFVAERLGSLEREEEDIDAIDTAVVGAALALALVPGASRIGTTVSAGMLRGLDRLSAARLAFLLSIPTVVLAGAYHAVRDLPSKHGPGAGLTGLALVLSFAVGLATLAWLMRWLSGHSFMIFAYYRLALGLLLMGLLGAGVVSATG